MGRKLYKHHTTTFILSEITQEQYEQLSRAEKKRYRSFAKKNQLPIIWTTNEQDKKAEYQNH
jgi:hypothetical protein